MNHRVLFILPKIPYVSVGCQMERCASVQSDRSIRDHLVLEVYGPLYSCIQLSVGPMVARFASGIYWKTSIINSRVGEGEEALMKKNGATHRKL